MQWRRCQPPAAQGPLDGRNGSIRAAVAVAAADEADEASAAAAAAAAAIGHRSHHQGRPARGRAVAGSGCPAAAALPAPPPTHTHTLSHLSTRRLAGAAGGGFALGSQGVWRRSQNRQWFPVNTVRCWSRKRSGWGAWVSLTTPMLTGERTATSCSAAASVSIAAFAAALAWISLLSSRAAAPAAMAASRAAASAAAATVPSDPAIASRPNTAVHTAPDRIVSRPQAGVQDWRASRLEAAEEEKTGGRGRGWVRRRGGRGPTAHERIGRWRRCTGNDAELVWHPHLQAARERTGQQRRFPDPCRPGPSRQRRCEADVMLVPTKRTSAQAAAATRPNRLPSPLPAQEAAVL